jgi:hypothetical protein
MRHLLVAAALLLAALIVTLGAATVLENMATNHQEPETEPYIPGSPPAPDLPSSPTVRKPPPPEQSRSLSLLVRHS